MDWRDQVLDRIADDDERRGLQAKADRLRHFLHDAREIAACDLATPGEPPRVDQWVAERLPELAHGRPVTTIGVYHRAWDALTLHFRCVSERDDAPHDAIAWLPEVQRLETELGHPQWVNDDGTDISLARRRLTDAERMEVIAMKTGAIRAPKDMAVYLLWLACRSREESLSSFRIQIERYKPQPVPLSSPPPTP